MAEYESEFETVKRQLKEDCTTIIENLSGRETKASAKRIRLATNSITKIGKVYRKLSMTEVQ